MMIASIKGEVIVKGENDLVILVGGIGFKVQTPKSVCVKTQLGDHASLFTYLVVREDALTLYGFESKEERDLFNLFLSVSGIGPKTAFSIISNLSVDVIINGVLRNQDEVFCQVPGIGKKSAQKIVLFMHDKLGHLVGKEAMVGFKDMNSQVMDALVGLGYSIVEAQSAIQAIPKNTPDDLETRLRIALQFFST
jgi:Holliday junction DNA helicase RuvA